MVPWTPWGSLTRTFVGGFMSPPFSRARRGGLPEPRQDENDDDQDDEHHHPDPEHPCGGAIGRPPQALIHPDAPPRCMRRLRHLRAPLSSIKVHLLRRGIG